MNKWLIGIVAVLVIIAAFFYTIQNKKITSTGEKIKVGVISPFTGPLADYGEEVKKGVLGAKQYDSIEFVFEDDKCEPKEAVSAFQKLVSVDKIKFIIGPGCGSPQEAIVPLLAQNNVIVLVPSAASRELYEKSGGDFFDIQYALEDESKFMAETLYGNNLKKVALVTYGNAFSKTHADSFKKNFKGTIAVDTVILDDNANIQTELTKIKAANVDAIYAPDVSFFFAGGVAKAKQLGIKSPIYTTYIAELPAVRPLVEGVMYSFPGELGGVQGAVFELSKQSADFLIPFIIECKAEVSCVKEKISSSGKFDTTGTFKRQIILKKIRGGEPISAQ